MRLLPVITKEHIKIPINKEHKRIPINMEYTRIPINMEPSNQNTLYTRPIIKDELEIVAYTIKQI